MQIHVWRNNYLRKDNHLNCIVFFRCADGCVRISDFVTNFVIYETVEDQVAFTLKCCTNFVKRNWVRIDVCIPNRDQYGNLRLGWIQDCGILLVTRNLEI